MAGVDGGTMSPRDGGAIVPRTDAGAITTDPPSVEHDGCACSASGSPLPGVLALALLVAVPSRR